MSGMGDESETGAPLTASQEGERRTGLRNARFLSPFVLAAFVLTLFVFGTAVFLKVKGSELGTDRDSVVLPASFVPLVTVGWLLFVVRRAARSSSRAAN